MAATLPYLGLIDTGDTVSYGKLSTNGCYGIRICGQRAPGPVDTLRCGETAQNVLANLHKVAIAQLHAARF